MSSKRKEFTIKDLETQVVTLRRENAELQKKYCTTLMNENAALQKDNKGLTADNETLLEKQNALQGTLLQLNDKISEAENKYSMLVEENLEKESTTNEERKQLEQNLAKAEKSIQDLKAQYDDITRDLEETFNALGCEGDDVVACANDTTEKITNAEKTIGDLETNLQTTTRELNELSESCTKYRGVVQEMRTTEEALLKELAECTMAKDENQEIIEQLDSHMVQVNSQIKEVLGCTEDGYVITCARKAADKINIAERKIKDMKDELQTAARNRENTEKANQSLSGNIEKIEGKIRKTKEVLGCKKNDDVAECAERMVQERNSTIERLKKTVEEKSAKVAEKSATITQLKIDAGELEEILNQMSYPKPEVESAFGCEPFESLEDCAQRVLRDKNDDYEETSTYEMSEVEMARASNQIFVEPPSESDESDANLFEFTERLKAQGVNVDFLNLPESELKLVFCSFMVFIIPKGLNKLSQLANGRLSVLKKRFTAVLKNKAAPSELDLNEAMSILEPLGVDFIIEELKNFQDERNFLMETETSEDPDLEQRLDVAIDDGTMMTNYDGDPTEAQSTRDGWSMEPTVPAPPPRAPRGDWGFAPRTVAAAMVPPYTSLPMTMRNNFRPVLGV